MIRFSDNNISKAGVEDAGVIAVLLNRAYRGEASLAGWTTEAGMIAGEIRTMPKEVEDLIQQPNSVFLKYKNPEIVGCVNLQQHENQLYLGMLSVSPELQNAGIGKKLLAAAEEYASSINCNSIYMTVISKRKELIDWYKRHGYVDTGVRKPFEEDEKSGRHLEKLEFLILKKLLQKLPVG